MFTIQRTKSKYRQRPSKPFLTSSFDVIRYYSKMLPTLHTCEEPVLEQVGDHVLT